MDTSLSNLIQKTNGDFHKLGELSVNTAALPPVIKLVSEHPEWDTKFLGKLTKSKQDWNAVYELLESYESSVFTNANSLAAILIFLSEACGENKLAISNLFNRKWKNLKHQNDLVLASSSLGRDKFDLGSIGLEKVVDLKKIDSKFLQERQITLSENPLNYKAIIHLSLEAICRDDDPLVSESRLFLDQQAKIVPELFMLGGITMPKPWPQLLERVIGNFFELFFAGQDSSSFIFSSLAILDRQFLIDILVEIYDRDPTVIGTILTIGFESEILSDLLKLNKFGFTIELAAQADKYQLYSFDSFIKESQKTFGQDFILSLLNYLELKSSLEYVQSQPGIVLGPNLRSVSAALNLVSSANIPQERLEQLKLVQIQCLQVYPRLINFGQGHDAAILAHNGNGFSPEIEREMKLYYQKMYEQQIEIRDIITMLQKLKQSDDPKDQDVFSCMVHSLFDEYRFFPEYPLNALATTAVLFGSLLYFRLIEGIPLSIALRLILDSLRQPPDSNMFRFGLQALYEFKQRLPEFPKYCTVLLEIPGMATNQAIYQQIKDIVTGEATRGGALDSEETTVFKSVSAYVHLDDTPQEEPNGSVKDKVLFIVNNIATNNVTSKTKDLVAVLEPKYYGWFASYIVGQRSKQEPNYHQLYIIMLKNIGSKALESHCLKITYQHIIQLLNSADTLTSSDKRNQLKNMGQWLGSLLLARDKPILYKNIDFKKLILEGYESKRLPVVLPFITRVLEKVTQSTVFNPPNPWLMGILQVLSELYQYTELKLNLKFEIEVLCNQFKLDITEIDASTIIRDIATSDKVDTHDMSLAAELQKLRLINSEAPQPLEPAIPESYGYGGIQLEGNSGFVSHPSLRHLFFTAIDKALKEVSHPIIERSVAIATIATREMVTKDFALEPDEHKLRAAAQNMVKQLASNMSLASLKEPLREALSSNLRTLMLSSNNFTDPNVLREQITIAINDNLDIICSLVDRSVVEKAIPEIEEALLPAYLIRQRHRETNPGQVFVDPQLNSRYPLQLPDPFRLHLGGLLPEQFSIYENFAKDSLVDQLPQQYSSVFDKGSPGVAAHVPPAAATAGPGATAPMAGPQPITAPGAAAAAPTVPAEQSILQIQHGIDTLMKIIEEAKETSISSLASDHPISILLTQILTLCSRSPLRDQISLKASQLSVGALFTQAETPFAREVLCFLLDKLCELSASTAKEVVLWLIYSDDERKHNVAAMLTLIKARLVSASEIDVNLANQILSRNPTCITFGVALIFEAVLGESACALRTDFTGSLEALEALAKSDQPVELAKELLETMEKNPTSSNLWPVSRRHANEPVQQGSKDQLGYIFAEWIRLTQHPCCSDKALHTFVYQLSKHGILSSNDLLTAFVRISLDMSVESSRKVISSQPSVSSDEAFVAVDAFSKLIITVLLTSSKMALTERVNYARAIFSVIILVFAADHDSFSEGYDGRPFFRLFSNILAGLAEAYEPENQFISEMYLMIANIFQSIQPLAFPGFSFAWLTLISHRFFLPFMIKLPNQRGWDKMAELLGHLVKFEGIYIDGKNFPETIAVLYKGTLRVFLVILHDYPEFLIKYHNPLCNSIPPCFIQLKNLVLSAFPRDMELPDPLAQGLKVDRLPEIKKLPPLAEDPSIYLTKIGLKKHIDSYLSSPVGSAIKAITDGFEISRPIHEPGIGFDSTKYDLKAISSFVVYIANESARVSKDEVQFNRDSAHVSLLALALKSVAIEGKYFLSEAIINQLRYTNRHTHFFSCVVLSIFGSHVSSLLGSEKTEVQHVLTRVLLERIMCNRPHPWGLMITFTELLKNPNYKFWELPFIKSTPELERVFSSLYTHIASSDTDTDKQRSK